MMATTARKCRHLPSFHLCPSLTISSFLVWLLASQAFSVISWYHLDNNAGFGVVAQEMPPEQGTGLGFPQEPNSMPPSSEGDPNLPNLIPPIMGNGPMVPQEMYDPYYPILDPPTVTDPLMNLVGTVVGTAIEAATYQRHRHHHNHRHHHRHHHHGYRDKRQASTYMLANNISLGYGDPAQESGPWEDWSPLSECSRACGGGVQFQTRICRERNYDGSQACIGASKRYFSCNIHQCLPETKDFREDQCSRFDSVPFEGNYYNWIPFSRVPNPCELNCRPQKYHDDRRFYYRHARKVLDGTPCYYNQTDRPLDVCIDGVCVELGCDRQLGSSLREDKCRVCGGNGQSCRTIEGKYEARDGFLNGYNDILLIPEGATNIVIREVEPTRNYLAIRNSEGVYYLNGDWKIQPPSAFQFASTTFYYERARKNEPSLPEIIKAKGPTSEKLVVVVLLQEENRGIDYEYSVPFKEHQTPTSVGISTSNLTNEERQHYAWIFGDYGECSRPCGTGVQRRDVFCARILNNGPQEPVVDTLCDSAIRPANTRTCSQAPCPASWKVGDWSECSCVHRIQKRVVYCSNEDRTSEVSNEEEGVVMLPDLKCKMSGKSKKPLEIRECHPDLSRCPKWIVGEWNECSAEKCGPGVQRRTVQCGRKSRQEEKKSAQLKVEEPKPLINNENKEEQKISVQKRETSTILSGTDVPSTISTENPTNVPSTTISTENPTNVPSTTISTENPTNVPSTIISTENPANVPSTTISTENPKNVPSTTISTENPTNDSLETTTTILPQPVAVTMLPVELSEPKEEIEYLDPVFCDSTTQPVEERPCAHQVCHEEGGLEWIVSDWTPASCEENKEIVTNQVRHVLCSTRNGTVYPDEFCSKAGRGDKPPTKKPCSTTADEPLLPSAVWFTSEWSHCNASCGIGFRTRTVFCGQAEGGSNSESCQIKKEEDETKCQIETKPVAVTGCLLPACHNVTFIGPLGPCSLPCGGGRRNRSALCFTQEEEFFGEKVTFKLVTHDEECHGKSSLMKTTEQCNIEDCDDDQVAAVLDCKDTFYGCCPNEISRAANKDLRNCPPMVANATNGIECEKSTWGCCPSKTIDGAAVQALGPFSLGCLIDCNNTKYGCCPDNVTMIVDGQVENCPSIPCRGEECPQQSTTPLSPTTTQAFTTVLPTLPPLSQNSSDFSLVTLVSDDTSIEGSGYSTIADGIELTTETDLEGSDGFVSTIKSIFNSITTTMLPTRNDEELNCTLSEFGCCPSGKKAASGLNYYGCSCEDFPYGCCQDRYTAASGPDYEGCLCSHMLYGCCADGKTPAIGPNSEGCGCDTTVHGCCPDMVTIAHGPNFHGCPCDTLKYGCCPGSNIPASGSNFEGCTCIESPHGCCPDGQSVALGPNFEGCPSGPPLDLKLQSEVCGLPVEIGSCRNFSVKWFFDTAYGDCNRFWYGGCEGNANRFSSQELCQRACVKPEGPERCSLPAITGPCNASEVAFYFDSARRSCERFTYGGCLGNTNRFQTLESCQQACLYEEKALDVCDQPMSSGPCQGRFRRWYYRKIEGRCRDFAYGGCQGNANNFQSEESCQSACASRTPFEICSLPKATGPCLGNFPRWHFDSATGVCREFTYTGCQGNRNRFVDRESCERMCNQTIAYYQRPVDYYPSVTVNEVVDTRNGSGQEENTYESVCALPKAEGSCRKMIMQWHFNSATRRCEQFYYSGCKGNANRFDDRESCEARCLVPFAASGVAYSQDPCLEPRESGPCSNYTIRYFFNIEDRSCHRFYYSGCGGSRNNFVSEMECIARCQTKIGGADSSIVSTTEPSSFKFKVDYCFQTLDVGSCNKNILKWYYDKRDGVCKEFYYGGCDGNDNRFESQAHCVESCYNSQDICRLPKVRGPCKKNFTQWYYNWEENECQEFEFSGCEGNANRFSSSGECEAQCKNGRPSGVGIGYSNPMGMSETQLSLERPMPPQCRLGRDSGPCKGYLPKWYYSPSENHCRMFIYGGCQGNDNRFDRREDCEALCTHRLADEEPRPDEDVKEVICRLPYEQGPCHDTQARWYYDSSSHNCFPFAYGGCVGNKNRFKSYESCIGFCRGVMGTELSQFPVQQPQYPEYPQQPQPEYQYPAVVLPTQPIQMPRPPSSSPAAGDVYCEPMECSLENCVLGIDRFYDNQGCPACRCTNPCNDQQCPDKMQCSVELFRDKDGKPQGRAECRLQNKPGLCPRNVIQYSNNDNAAKLPNCVDQCRNDADCRHTDKCCNNGCANICVEPEAGSYDSSMSSYYYNHSLNNQEGNQGKPVQPAEQDVYRTDLQETTRKHGQTGNKAWNEEDDEDETEVIEIDQSTSGVGENQATEKIVTVQAGQDAFLDCPVVRNNETGSENITPATTVSWSRDGLSIGSRPTDANRYGMANNGSLGIISVSVDDQGTYACSRPVPIGNEVTGVKYLVETRYIRLVVNFPVLIEATASRKVIGRLGSSVQLRCNVQGHPRPNITWTKNGAPLESIELGMPRNRQFRLSRFNHTLTLRDLVDADQGVYRCHAFNGIGQPAVWDVQLLLDTRFSEPEIIPFNPSLFNQPDSTGHGGNYSAIHSAEELQPTPLDQIGASIQVSPRDYRVNSTLQLDCIVRSQITGKFITPPEASIIWNVKSSDIPLAIDASNHHHYRLLTNQTLQVFNLAKTDTGEYRCLVNTKPTVKAMASIYIQVDDHYVPPDCKDSPFFLQCAQIVKASYCSNEQYRKFCCRSCFLADMIH